MTLLISILAFLIFWYLTATWFRKLGFMEDEIKLLEEDNKKMEAELK